MTLEDIAYILYTYYIHNYSVTMLCAWSDLKIKLYYQVLIETFKMYLNIVENIHKIAIQVTLQILLGCPIYISIHFLRIVVQCDTTNKHG